jgi:hypothetical protein
MQEHGIFLIKTIREADKQLGGWWKTAVLIHYRLAENIFGAADNCGFLAGATATNFMRAAQHERWLSRRFFGSVFKRFTENTLPVK